MRCDLVGASRVSMGRPYCSAPRSTSINDSRIAIYGTGTSTVRVPYLI